ncbi:MAG: hypothetical protein ACLT1L_03765 [Leuconostoc lactis]|uniref:hypothetical protein n=1 Tax=Leuconostoc lactis TaxID=1246 RepID=UPI003991C5C3
MKKVLSETVEINSDQRHISEILLSVIPLLKKDPSVIDVQQVESNEYIILRRGVFNRQDTLFVMESENKIKYRIDGYLLKYAIVWEFNQLTSESINLTQILYVEENIEIMPVFFFCNTILSKQFNAFLSNVKLLSETFSKP